MFRRRRIIASSAFTTTPPPPRVRRSREWVIWTMALAGVGFVAWSTTTFYDLGSHQPLRVDATKVAPVASMAAIDTPTVRK